MERGSSVLSRATAVWSAELLSIALRSRNPTLSSSPQVSYYPANLLPAASEGHAPHHPDKTGASVMLFLCRASSSPARTPRQSPITLPTQTFALKRTSACGRLATIQASRSCKPQSQTQEHHHEHKGTSQGGSFTKEKTMHNFPAGSSVHDGVGGSPDFCRLDWHRIVLRAASFGYSNRGAI